MSSNTPKVHVLTLQEIADTKMRINKMKVAELKDVCRTMELKLAGKRQELIDRITEYFQQGVNHSDTIRLLAMRIIVLKRCNGSNLPPYKQLYNAIRSGDYRDDDQSDGEQDDSIHSRDTRAYRGHSLYFKDSPLYTLKRLVHGSPQLCPASKNRVNIQFQFILNKEENDWLVSGDPSYRFHFLCGMKGKDKLTTTDVLIQYPNPCELNVNGTQISNQFKGIKGKVGTAKPADVTSLLKPSPAMNKVNLLYNQTSEDFLAYLYIVQLVPIETILSRILSHPHIHKTTTLQKILSQQDDEEIEIANSNIPLRDPVSYTRLKYPVQSIACRHTQCFDAEIFLEAQLQIPSWVCPVCQINVTVDDLAVSDYFVEILTSIDSNVNSITIQSDGTWQIESEDRDDDLSDDSDDQHHNGFSRGSSNAPHIEAIVLDSESESEDEEVQIPSVPTFNPESRVTSIPSTPNLGSLNAATSEVRVPNSNTPDVDRASSIDSLVTSPGMSLSPSIQPSTASPVQAGRTSSSVPPHPIAIPQRTTSKVTIRSDEEINTLRIPQSELFLSESPEPQNPNPLPNNDDDVEASVEKISHNGQQSDFNDNQNQSSLRQDNNGNQAPHTQPLRQQSHEGIRKMSPAQTPAQLHHRKNPVSNLFIPSRRPINRPTGPRSTASQRSLFTEDMSSSSYNGTATSSPTEDSTRPANASNESYERNSRNSNFGPRQYHNGDTTTKEAASMRNQIRTRYDDFRSSISLPDSSSVLGGPATRMVDSYIPSASKVSSNEDVSSNNSSNATPNVDDSSSTVIPLKSRTEPTRTDNDGRVTNYPRTPVSRPSNDDRTQYPRTPFNRSPTESSNQPIQRNKEVMEHNQAKDLPEPSERVDEFVQVREISSRQSTPVEPRNKASEPFDVSKRRQFAASNSANIEKGSLSQSFGRPSTFQDSNISSRRTPLEDSFEHPIVNQVPKSVSRTSENNNQMRSNVNGSSRTFSNQPVSGHYSRNNNIGSQNSTTASIDATVASNDRLSMLFRQYVHQEGVFREKIAQLERDQARLLRDYDAETREIEKSNNPKIYPPTYPEDFVKTLERQDRDKREKILHERKIKRDEYMKIHIEQYERLLAQQADAKAEVNIEREKLKREIKSLETNPSSKTIDDSPGPLILSTKSKSPIEPAAIYSGNNISYSDKIMPTQNPEDIRAAEELLKSLAAAASYTQSSTHRVDSALQGQSNQVGPAGSRSPPNPPLVPTSQHRQLNQTVTTLLPSAPAQKRQKIGSEEAEPSHDYQRPHNPTSFEPFSTSPINGRLSGIYLNSPGPAPAPPRSSKFGTPSSTAEIIDLTSDAED